MFKLLNRFAFILSLSLWFIIFFLIWVLFDIMGWSYSMLLDSDMFLIWIIWSIIFWMIFKKIFLSKIFIQSRLEYFANSLNIRKTVNNNIASSVKKLEKIENIENEIDVKVENVGNNFNYYEELEEEQNEEKEFNDEVKVKENIKVKEEPSKIAIYIKQFFSENILAKLWSILVFLWVLFLMSLIWNQIPSVWKIIIGFVIWFGVYFSWVILDNKWYKWESRILIGAWILINYLVILAWKYLIWDNFWAGTGWVLGTWVAFLFLILNTVFAIATSFIYKSRTLLVFSFIFAYLNPLLVWGGSDTPYLLLWYSMIVSLWALFIWFKNNDNILKYSAFILWNLLFLIAPISFNLSPYLQEIAWITKMLFTGILWFLTILTFYKNISKSITTVFIINYIFIILQLFWWENIWVLWSSIGFITYMISILLFFWVWIWLFVMESMKSIIALVTFPILIVLWILFTWGLNFLAPALWIVVLSYLIWFSFLWWTISSFSRYLFFIILWWFIFAVNSFISFRFFGSINNDIIINFNTFITSVIVSFVFLFTAYHFSRRENQEFLYSIWTVWWILTFIPVIMVWTIIWLSNKFPINTVQNIPQSIINLSIISVIIFWVANQLLPFINKNLVSKLSNVKNLVTWSIFGVIFIGFELFMFWNKYFPWISLWFAFVILAIIYFILGLLMMNKLWVNEVKKELTPQNSILSYLFISISLFSLAIALVFSNHPEIISTIWLFEATILFYFFSKTNENKIFAVWIILFMIWISKMFGLHDIVKSKDFMFLVPFTIIFVSLVLNLKYLNFVESWIKRISHDILHILWIWVLWSLLLVIIPSTWHGWSILWMSIFIYIIWTLYSYFKTIILKIFFVVIFSLFMLYHLKEFNYINFRIDGDKLWYLIVLQYISTLILSLVLVSWNKINKIYFINNIVNLAFSVYLFFIVSNYILDIFDITFAVTIFWWIVSSILLFYGISSDKIKYRTIWLYLLTVVLFKIFANDLWYWLNDAVTRVIAFIWIWILLIIISTRYTKKYWNNLKWEFNLKNLSGEIPHTEPILKKTSPQPSPDKEKEKENKVVEKMNNKKIKEDENKNNKKVSEEINEKVTKKTNEKSFVINEKIENIDIWNIKSVEFIFAWRNVRIRAVNLIKIVKLIIDNFGWKTSFKPLELKKVMVYIKDNYKSELSKDNYDKIIEILDWFVINGWDVKFIEK